MKSRVSATKLTIHELKEEFEPLLAKLSNKYARFDIQIFLNHRGYASRDVKGIHNSYFIINQKALYVEIDIFKKLQ